MQRNAINKNAEDGRTLQKRMKRNEDDDEGEVKRKEEKKNDKNGIEMEKNQKRMTRCSSSLSRIIFELEREIFLHLCVCVC